MFERCCKCLKPLNEGDAICPSCGFNQVTYTVDAHQLDLGTVLNSRYEIGMVLGEGGFGITYVGRDTVLNMRVAIKEFFMHGYVSRSSPDDPTLSIGTGTYAETFLTNKDKFIREARVLAQFSNERGIVGIRDYFEQNNTAYLVMDFLEGQTLASYLKKNETISWDKLYEIMRPVLKSLSTIHKEHIIHRDISPDNIMITNDGEVKLLDFGAARAVSENDVKSLSVILKPGYAPEEQYRSKGQQGPWTDIYALCATMYKSLTGKTPDDSMERMFDDKVLSPKDAGADCPDAVSDVIMKGMSVRQENRYQSVAEFMEALDAAKEAPQAQKAEEMKPEPAKETPKPAEDNSDRTVLVNDSLIRQPEQKPQAQKAEERKPEPAQEAPQAQKAEERKPEPAQEAPKPVAAKQKPQAQKAASEPEQPVEKKSKKGLVIVAICAAFLLVVGGVALILFNLNTEENQARNYAKEALSLYREKELNGANISSEIIVTVTMSGNHYWRFDYDGNSLILVPNTQGENKYYDYAFESSQYSTGIYKIVYVTGQPSNVVIRVRIDND